MQQPENATPRPPQWWESVHRLWLQAMTVHDVTMIAESVYRALAQLPDVVAAAGCRWTRDGPVYLRLLSAQDAPVRSWRPADRDWPGTDGCPPVVPTHALPTTRSAASPHDDAQWGPAGSLLRGAGAVQVVECVFALGTGDSAGLWLGLRRPVSPEALEELRARLVQVADILTASNHRIQETHRHERRRARDAFLAEASLQMDASLDAEETLRRVARLAVPAVAEGCLIHLTGSDGRLRPVAVAHVAASTQRWLTRAAEQTLWLTAALHGRVHRHGAALLYDAEMRHHDVAVLHPPGSSPPSAVTVSPLAARGRTLGTLTFLYGQDHVEDAHLRMVQDLAGRAALAIDTTTLYAQRRQHVELLQKHLLPRALPEVADLDLSAAYAVGDASLDVGGDFYDVVVRPDRVCLFIGDVCGRGAEAAAFTALARHTLRTLLEEGVGPGTALSRLNSALLHEGSTRFVTALIAVLTPRADGTGWQAELVSAGHPGPLVRDSEGTVRTEQPKGLLLGVVPDATYHPRTVRLDRGDALVLFTDGLTEARSAQGVQFEEQLPDAVRKYAAVPGTAATDLVAAAAAFREQGDDDTAVLIAKVKEQQ
ncbi:GAF domain-containing SpoIIE family protein phosphatase [Streptomyces sp. NPDC047123]|uniref:PP2C family protein-serine/threonine phosphatase n=1 Tax=Streptomyces sp. NPDC047123 TaxID=3155622 RepID=UPI0033E44D2E